MTGRRESLLQMWKKGCLSTAYKTKTKKNNRQLNQTFKNNVFKNLGNPGSDEKIWENKASLFSIKEQNDQTVTVASVQNKVSVESPYVKTENSKTKFVLDTGLVINLIRRTFKNKNHKNKQSHMLRSHFNLCFF